MLRAWMHYLGPIVRAREPDAKSGERLREKCYVCWVDEKIPKSESSVETKDKFHINSRNLSLKSLSPTRPVPILELLNPLHDVPELHKIRRLKGFKAPILWKGSSRERVKMGVLEMKYFISSLGPYEYLLDRFFSYLCT